MDQLALDHKPLPPDLSLPTPASSTTHPPFDDASHLVALSSTTAFDPGFALPSTPTSLATPSHTSFPSPDAKLRKPNPLNDLIDTEKTYVDQLTGIIRKVAAAWSRSNLPPPDLDVMFRSVEGIYKASRIFFSKLKDIGANPSSPKALGDLLMRWIDDLKSPYAIYCTKYRCNFDSWDPVQSNTKLPNILHAFSSSTPPPSSATASNITHPPTWTLDDLFLLPKARLKYYRKLYGRLLKSTAPGKSDYKLLVGALETLDGLLDTLESRSSVRAGESESLLPAPPTQRDSEDVVIDLRTQSVLQQEINQNGVRLSTETYAGSESSSARGSSISGEDRLSRGTVSTSVSRGSSGTMSMPISDLERRLSTQRTMDIFTMKPKVVRLQITPPNLTFAREVRLSVDVTIRFTPQSTGVEVVHALGHIYLLSDLFLISERMSSEEKSQHGSDGAEMWLCYPPLAGKVLRVFEVPEQPYALRVAVMRKESLILETESPAMRDLMMIQFKECIEFSQSLPPPSKEPPPPVPPLSNLLRVGLDRQTPTQQAIASSSNPLSPSPSPHHEVTSAFPRTRPPPYQAMDQAVAEDLSRLALSSDTQGVQGAQRMPLMSNPVQDPGVTYHRTSITPPQHPNGSSNGHMSLPGEQPPLSMRPNFNFQGPPRPGSAHSSGPAFGRPNSNNPALMADSVRPAHYSNPPAGAYGPHMPAQHRQPGLIQIPPSNHPGLPPGALAPYPYPPRPPSEPGFERGPHPGIRKTPSNRSLASQYSPFEQNMAPPIPPFPGGNPPNQTFLPRSSSYNSLPASQPHLLLPSLQPTVRSVSMAASFDEPSPPNSPVQGTPKQLGPVTSTISADMKCKVFLQQQHSQWKSLGSAKLKLYREDPTNVKQLVVAADNKEKSIIISTIVLTDGVERVGKTGVAIELSDKGMRTGIIYMIQLRNETSAEGLFGSLLQGSDRASRNQA